MKKYRLFSCYPPTLTFNNNRNHLFKHRVKCQVKNSFIHFLNEVPVLYLKSSILNFLVLNDYASERNIVILTPLGVFSSFSYSADITYKLKYMKRDALL